MKARGDAVVILVGARWEPDVAHRLARAIRAYPGDDPRGSAPVACRGREELAVDPAPDGTPACATCWPEEWTAERADVRVAGEDDAE